MSAHEGDRGGDDAATRDAEPARDDAAGGADRDVVARSRALGAGLAMLVVVLTYGASGLGDPDRWWASGLAIVVGILLVDGLEDLKSLLPLPGLAPLALIGVLFAIALCVPETDQLPIVALLPGALLFLEIVEQRQLPIEWYAVAAAAIGWGGMFGATGRQSALAGALFAWWVVLLPAFLQAMHPIVDLRRAIAVVMVAGLAAAVFARTGGLTDRNAELVIALVSCGILSFVVASAIARTPTAATSPDS